MLIVYGLSGFSCYRSSESDSSDSESDTSSSDSESDTGSDVSARVAKPKLSQKTQIRGMCAPFFLSLSLLTLLQTNPNVFLVNVEKQNILNFVLPLVL